MNGEIFDMFWECNGWSWTTIYGDAETSEHRHRPRYLFPTKYDICANVSASSFPIYNFFYGVMIYKFRIVWLYVHRQKWIANFLLFTMVNGIVKLTILYIYDWKLGWAFSLHTMSLLANVCKKCM